MSQLAGSERNWAGNYAYRAARIHTPSTVDELRRLVARSRRVKALGSRHSFNGIADTAGDLISLSSLERHIHLDPEAGTVTIDGGVRYGDLCGPLNAQNFALHNLASLPHISVAGACATATHGSGDRNACLAAAVSALELVTADGGLIRLERGNVDFDGAVVGLGALGIVTRLTLDLLPAFRLRQDVFENLPLEQLEGNFDAITSGSYSVSLFTDWQQRRFNQIWRKQKTDSPLGSARVDVQSSFFGSVPASRPLHPIACLSSESCTEQLGVEGAWHERLPHFRVEFTPSAGDELQSEYLVPRAYALAAIRAAFDLGAEMTPLLQISEVRTVAEDTLWMSPCFEQACVALHFTWVPDGPAVAAFLPRLEEALAPFQARPHWGKLFTMRPGSLPPLYPRWDDFRSVMEKYDPDGKFRNDFLDEVFR